MNATQISAFQAAIVEACHSVGDVNYRSYSGRAMYGRECLAISGSSSDCNRVLEQVAVDLLHDAADGRLEEAEDLMRILWSHNQDQMGLDVVLYWSEIDVPEEEG